MQKTNPISDYFLYSISPASGGDFGWECAKESVKQAKQTFGLNTPLLGYINAWNIRSGKPLTDQQVNDLDKIKFENDQTDNKPKPLPGVPLFG